MKSKSTKLSSKAVVVCIQAVAQEMRRLRALTEEETVAGDELWFVDCQSAADELEELYISLMEAEPNLPQYLKLVGQAPKS